MSGGMKSLRCPTPFGIGLQRQAVSLMCSGLGKVRHRTHLCMYKGLCYLASNGFAPLRQYPLSLTQGNIRANLQRLDGYTGIVDHLTADILLCYRLDPGPGRTIEALTLLQHACGSTGLCEKGHAPISICKRQHDRLEVSSLRLQAFAHLQAPFLRLSRADQTVVKSERDVQAVLDTSATPKMLSAKMALLHEIHAGYSVYAWGRRVAHGPGLKVLCGHCFSGGLFGSSSRSRSSNRSSRGITSST